MNNFREKSNFIWAIADLLRDTFKRGKYQDIILPFTVLRRIDSVLVPTKEDVLARYKQLKGRLEDPYEQLCRASGFAFYNTSKFTFDSLLDDHAHLADNLNNYINGFSENMRLVLEKFDLGNTITKLDEANLLYLVMERFNRVNLHPDHVDNHTMGYIFEDLIRRFNEALNENPGEHYTPREVIRLMVNLLLSRDEDMLQKNHIVRTVYDPCCGSGGMLTIAKEHIQQLNPLSDVYLFGQEVNPETWAVSKADLFMKSADGEDAENIMLGSTLSNDQHATMKFDYQITNPPYGKEWKGDQVVVRAEAERGNMGRFGAGLPRISDGQLLFLQHMLARMRSVEEGGGRIAIVLNGSPLFTGDAGSGESEIRRWILENDYLEAIIALPEQIFYNTGIATYIWVLSNRKEEKRIGKVQLINASDLWQPMRRSLGEKRREISEEHIAEIKALYEDLKHNKRVKVFDSTAFGYRKITVERPLRLNFQASQERIARLQNETAFQNLAKSKKKQKEARLADEQAGRQQQEAILKTLSVLPGDLFKDRRQFEAVLDGVLEKHELKLSASLRKAVLNALSERDESAEICVDKKGQPEADSELRDYENVPLGEDIDAYFAREVEPHVPDAWINREVVDKLDEKVGKVGYEINFNRYFYEYVPPRPLEEIEAEIHQLQDEIMQLIREMNGEGS